MDLRGEADRMECYKTREKIDEALAFVSVEIATMRTARMRWVKP